MNYSDDIKRRLRLGEDSGWEFKQIEFSGDRPTSPKRDDLADEIAAFANAHGGVLLCGATDDGAVHGMSRAQIDALDALLVEISTDSIKPPARVQTHHREVDGKALLALEIPEGDAQHESPGGSYLRVGASKRLLTSDERLRLAQRRGQAPLVRFDEQPVPDTGIGTLDKSLWKPLLSAEGRADPATGLAKMGFLAEDEHGATRATVAGVLVCCSNPEEWLPNACIMATSYRGEDRSTGQLDARTIVGPLQQQIADALAFVVRTMRVGAHKDPSRTDLPQYSTAAIFEAVVNAVAHRDYSRRGSCIRLSMFDDRLEIQSPGLLPNGLAVDNLAHQQATRNRALASALSRLPTNGTMGRHERQYVMERRGDGVPIIQRETRQLAGHSPRFDLVGEDFRVTLPAAATEFSPARVALTILGDGHPVPEAEVLALFPNGTWQRATSGALGQATVGLHRVDLPMTLFVAAPGFAAHCEHQWVPNGDGQTIDLEPIDGGAVVFPEGSGQIPGLKGRLNPIRDHLDRTYLYGSNVAINQGRPQPVHFALGEELRLTDSLGRELLANIVEIVGRSSLVEYRKL